MTEKIKLSSLYGRTLTFNATDYMTIRREHRLVGKLIGVPVNNPRSIAHNSLPGFYNQYETKLMLEEGFVVLEDKGGLRELPTENVVNQFQDHQKRIVDELQKPYIEGRLEATKTNMEQIVKGKIKKLVKAGVPEEEIDISPEQILNEVTVKLQQSISSKSNVYVQIPTQHPFLVHSEPVNDITVQNTQKYKVFKDLWRKGFHLTTGDSFGCDFLAYPGDPMLYHASQTVHVVDPNQKFDIKCLISKARLSVSVNKKCVFAYTDDDDVVTYQTLSWDNPKLRQLYTIQPDSEAQ